MNVAFAALIRVFYIFINKKDIGERSVKNLWEELKNYSASDYYPFHMPGHKRSLWPGYKPFPQEGALACYKPFPIPYQYDITEIEGFDNLHDAKGLLLTLQQRAARVYHAEESFFLVNGSTGGILSAVSAVAQDGKKLLMARNCHKSVYHAVQLNRLHAEYLWPDMIEEFDIQGEISAAQVREHLKNRKDICGVVITSPTYDGMISDIKEIAETVHACGIPLIVDEAHGAHFALSEKAPASAVECGADIVINSVHKTLPALTQTALLHVQGTRIDRERLRSYLHIYQSSSPSYLLMASLDACVDFIEREGQKSYERLLAFRRRISEKVADFSYIRILPAEERRDPGKLVISVKKAGMTGQELYQMLLQKYYLQMEMAAPSYVLGILTGMDTSEGVERLVYALEEIDREIAERRAETKFHALQETDSEIDERVESCGIKKKERADDIYNTVPTPSGLSIYEAAGREKEWIFPEESAGRISGGFLCFYPPGIPFLVPGEIIGEKQVSLMKRCRERNEYLTGVKNDGKICVLAGNNASFKVENMLHYK